MGGWYLYYAFRILEPVRYKLQMHVLHQKTFFAKFLDDHMDLLYILNYRKIISECQVALFYCHVLFNVMFYSLLFLMPCHFLNLNILKSWNCKFEPKYVYPNYTVWAYRSIISFERSKFENQTTHIKQTFNVSLLFSKLSNPLKFEYQGCFCGSWCIEW